MYRHALVFLALLSLMSATDCGNECFFFGGSGTLSVTLENSPLGSVASGETIWFSADFPAELPGTSFPVTLTENGGLFVTRIFRIGADSASVEPALSAFTPVATVGTLIPLSAEDDPAGQILKYECPDGRCSFRQGFRAEQAGDYLFQVVGSAYEVVADRLGNCQDPVFERTELNAPSNLGGLTLRYPLNYSEERGFATSIDTFFQRNLIYLTVR